MFLLHVVKFIVWKFIAGRGNVPWHYVIRSFTVCTFPLLIRHIKRIRRGFYKLRRSRLISDINFALETEERGCERESIAINQSRRFHSTFKSMDYPYQIVNIHSWPVCMFILKKHATGFNLRNTSKFMYLFYKRARVYARIMFVIDEITRIALCSLSYYRGVFWNHCKTDFPCDFRATWNDLSGRIWSKRYILSSDEIITIPLRKLMLAKADSTYHAKPCSCLYIMYCTL